ncbi:DUF2971 domain-containing protein [Thiobacillus sp.]
MSKNAEAPGERPFYKYASPTAALAILRSKKVRYSSPLSFNDPFDVQSGLHFDFDMDTLHDRVLERIYQLASAPEAPLVDDKDAWGQVVLVARKYYPTHGFDRERWEKLTGPSFNQLVQAIKKTQREYQEHWREVLLPGIRVFCVSEEKDNLLMWAHYAKDHKGCVFEFWSLPEEDNPLSVARRVNYVDAPLPFYSEGEWLDDLVGIKKLDSHGLYRRYAYAKSKHWSYEREWRVWYPLADTSGEYDEMPIRSSELRAIYIGCKASREFIEDIVPILRRSFPEARVYQATKKEDAYALTFAEI